eukprot:36685_1
MGNILANIIIDAILYGTKSTKGMIILLTIIQFTVYFIVPLIVYKLNTSQPLFRGLNSSPYRTLTSKEHLYIAIYVIFTCLILLSYAYIALSFESHGLYSSALQCSIMAFFMPGFVTFIVYYVWDNMNRHSLLRDKETVLLCVYIIIGVIGVWFEQRYSSLDIFNASTEEIKITETISNYDHSNIDPMEWSFPSLNPFSEYNDYISALMRIILICIGQFAIYFIFPGCVYAAASGAGRGSHSHTSKQKLLLKLYCFVALMSIMICNGMALCTLFGYDAQDKFAMSTWYSVYGFVPAAFIVALIGIWSKVD